MAVTDPITLTHTELLTGKTLTTLIQPLTGTDGGDGTKTTPASKVTANVWSPFKGLVETTEFAAAPATRITTTADNTSVIAGGLAKL